jgi:hypothetical protein
MIEMRLPYTDLVEKFGDKNSRGRSVRGRENNVKLFHTA